MSPRVSLFVCYFLGWLVTEEQVWVCNLANNNNLKPHQASNMANIQCCRNNLIKQHKTLIKFAAVQVGSNSNFDPKRLFHICNTTRFYSGIKRTCALIKQQKYTMEVQNTEKVFVTAL